MVLLRSFIPPRTAGGLRPTFQLFKGTGLSSLDNLETNMTINSQTMEPTFLYKGGAASTSLWTATYGSDLDIVNVGADVTPNCGSPLLDPDSVSVCFNSADYFQGPSDSVGDFGTDDWVLECVVKTPVDGSTQYPFGKYATRGWIVRITSAPQFNILAYGASSTQQLYSGTLASGTWYHIICFFDASGNSRCYVNGAVSGSGGTYSAAGDIDPTAASELKVGYSSGTSFNSDIAFLATWQGAGWLDSDLQANLAKERFAKLCGVWPQKAKGTALPTTMTRASTAMLDKLENSNTTRKLYKVGSNWMRCVSRLDGNGDEAQGYLSENAITNKCLYSEDISNAAAWTELDAGDSVGGSVTTPNGRTSTTSGHIADSTDGTHGVSQSVTVTAETWTASAFMKKGDKDWAFIWNNSVANCRVWFNLSTGVVGTTAAAVVGASIEDWGNGWYRCSMTFTGTAAGHAIRFQSADADGDSAVPGDGATVNTYIWGTQVELADTMRSYVPTTTAAATKAVDTLTFKGDDGNIKNNGVGAIEIKTLNPDYAESTLALVACSLNDGGATADRIQLYASNNNATILTAATGGDGGSIASSTDVVDGILNTTRLLWETDNLEAFVNGVSVGTDVDADIPDDLDRIDVGKSHTTSNNLNGVIAEFKLFDKRTKRG